MHNYKELHIWVKSFEIAKEVYQLSCDFPDTEKFGLTSQIRRCAISTPSNIAKGSSRKSNKDFCRFLEMALGSSFELETQLELASDIFKVNESKIELLIKKINENQKKINGFIKKLRV